MNHRDQRPRRRAAALPLAQMILHLVPYGANLSGAWDKAREAHGALTADTRTPHQLLWRRAFACALSEALRAARVNVQQDETELAAAVDAELSEALETSAEFGETELIDPVNFAAYPPVRERFPAFVRRIDPAFAADAEADRLRQRLDDALRQGLRRAWSEDVARFEPIVARFQGPMAEGARREAAWMRHWQWVRRKYEVEPVFSPQQAEVAIPLARLYVPLRAVRHEAVEPDSRRLERRYGLDPETGPSERRAHVGWLRTHLRGWLDAGGRDDFIRVVAGGPGSGKSSFAEAFATSLILETNWRVVFVELQHLRLSGDLRADLAAYFRDRSADGAGFPADPLEWRREDRAPYLLVFDGLDELARSEERATELTRRFIFNLNWMLMKAGGDPPPKALVLGRSAAADEGRRDAELPLSTLLHVLPFRPPTRRDLMLSQRTTSDALAEAGDDVVDQESVLDHDVNDQRYAYWRGWQQVHGAPVEPVPQGLTHPDLADLSAEPLLLHLLIVSGYLTPKLWRAAADNRNLVYEAIFEQVYERDRRAGKWAVARIEEADFFTLMECMGLATWAGGGRTGSEEEFLRLRGLHAAGKRERKFAQLPNADLKSVAVQFYTRRELGDAGYEFIHKSFGEYLIARALLAAARRARDDLERRDIADVALDWVRIAGLAEVSAEVLQFLRDEVRRTPEDAAGLKDDLQELMSWTLAEGMPAHRLDEPESFRATEARQRYAEGALLAVLNACARALVQGEERLPPVALNWPDQLALKQLLERLRLGRRRFALETVFDSIAWPEATPDETAVTNPHPHLLNNADLSVVTLRYADLEDANLFAANLEDANLRGADLCDAKLDDANLRGAYLVRANLRGAYLVRANLVDANLVDANLVDANLEDANLEDANLRGANLGGADLGRADLGGADLEDANLFAANLEDANLRGAVGLTQSQLGPTRGSADTQLPEGLARPEAWEA